MVDVVDMKLNDVVKLIRGRAGTIVRLGVMPETGGEPKIDQDHAGQDRAEGQEARGAIIEEGKKADGSPFKLGVIDLPSFYMDMKGAREGNDDFKSCTRDVRRILDDFNKKGVDAVVLDLRKNGGGSLTEAIILTGLFIEQGPGGAGEGSRRPRAAVRRHRPRHRLEGPAGRDDQQVQRQRQRDSGRRDSGLSPRPDRRRFVDARQRHRAEDDGSGPAAVPHCQSAGPRLAEAHHAAVLSPQRRQHAAARRAVRHRAAVAHRPHGRQRSAIWIIRSRSTRCPPCRSASTTLWCTPNVVSTLKELSTQRIDKSADFGKLQKNIERYEEQKAKKEVPLNEKKFLARRAEFDADKEEEKTFEEQANGTTRSLQARLLRQRSAGHHARLPAAARQRQSRRRRQNRRPAELGMLRSGRGPRPSDKMPRWETGGAFSCGRYKLRTL